MKPVGLRDPRTGKMPVGRRAATPRKPARRLLQPRRLPEPPQISANRPASSASSPASKTPTSCATARSTATPTSTRPALLDETLQLRSHPNIFFAGQLSGVEGYTESIATGMLAGLYAAALAHRRRSPHPFRAHRTRLARPLHHPRRRQTLPSRQHHLRPARPARRRPAAKSATRESATASSANAH